MNSSCEYRIEGSSANNLEQIHGFSGERDYAGRRGLAHYRSESSGSRAGETGKIISIPVLHDSN